MTGLTFQPIEARPAPVNTDGLIPWIRINLFSNVMTSIGTVVLGGLPIGIVANRDMTARQLRQKRLGFGIGFIQKKENLGCALRQMVGCESGHKCRRFVNSCHHGPSGIHRALPFL